MVQKSKANLKIREAVSNADMPYWFLADLLGIHRSTLSEWLRHELPEEEQQRIIQLIQDEVRRRETV